MKILLVPLRWAYALIRRLGIVDITWLMHMPSGELVSSSKPDGYDIRTIPLGELAELIRAGHVDRQVGDYHLLENGDRVLVGAFHGSRLVSFAWFAKHNIAAGDNYSRSPHLGTSIDLPEGTAFVFNAWTDMDHRGRRLLSSLIRWAIRNRVAGSWSLATMIDWANDRSCRAFEHLGMKRLGLIVRVGKGPLQFSLLPAAARQVGIRVAHDAPGMKLAT